VPTYGACNAKPAQGLTRYIANPRDDLVNQGTTCSQVLQRPHRVTASHGRAAHSAGDARGAPRHDEQLADHARALANVLLHQLAARHADEGAVGVVRDRARQQRLARPGRPVQQHALRTVPGASYARAPP